MQRIIELMLSLIETLGGPGIALAIALESIFPPIPSEVVLPAAGFSAAQGRIGVVAVVIWATVGSVVGAMALYGLGRALGQDRLERIAAKVPLVSSDEVQTSQQWFERHGPKAVLIGRLVPVVRSLISIPAGVQRMPIGRFAAYTTVGSLAWNSLLVGAGYALGDRWHDVEPWISRYQMVILAIAAVALAWFVVTRLRRRRQQRA